MSNSGQVSLSNFGYCSMGHGRSDYEGYYGISLNKPRYGYHCHDFYEFFLHISGARDFGVDNEMYLLQPNQLVIVPPFHMHGLMWDQVLPRYERAFLYCSADYLSTIGSGQIDLPQLFSEKLKGQGCLIYNLSDETASECTEYLKTLMANCEKFSPLDHFRDLSYLLPFFRIILDTMDDISPQQPNTSLNPLMHQVLVYINEHFIEPLTLDSLSEQFGISVSTLSHEFMHYVHHSVYNYIIYRRVMLAREKLFEEISLGEISDLCGFGDYSNFLRSFKKLTGVSPSEYRAQLQAHQSKAKALDL